MALGLGAVVGFFIVSPAAGQMARSTAGSIVGASGLRKYHPEEENVDVGPRERRIVKGQRIAIDGSYRRECVRNDLLRIDPLVLAQLKSVGLVNANNGDVVVLPPRCDLAMPHTPHMESGFQVVYKSPSVSSSLPESIPGNAPPDGLERHLAIVVQRLFDGIDELMNK